MVIITAGLIIGGGLGLGYILLAPNHQTLPVIEEYLNAPTEEEIAAANEPRHYPPQDDALMTLTVDSVKLYDVPVVDYQSEWDLTKGVAHLPESDMPWDDADSKNVYLAGHRVGIPDTTGRMLLYNLNQVNKGDSIDLNDTSGNTYEYQVSEIFVVPPDADWAVDPVPDRDIVTLQTCTMPDFENRLIVRADRV